MTIAVESINRKSVPENAKLEPLIEHFCLEDKKAAILQLASLEKVTVSYKTSNRRRKPNGLQNLQKAKHCYACAVPQGKKAIGYQVEYLWSFVMKMVVVVIPQLKVV